MKLTILGASPTKADVRILLDGVPVQRCTAFTLRGDDDGLRLILDLDIEEVEIDTPVQVMS